MTPDLTRALLPAAAAFAELGIYSIAGFLVFRKAGHTFAEAVSYGIIASLMAVSFIFQAAFIIGLPAVAIGIEGVLIVVSAAVIYHLRRLLRGVHRPATDTLLAHPLGASLLALCVLYLAVLAILGFHSAIEWYELPQALDIERSGLFLQNSPDGIDMASDPLRFPVNQVILAHMLLRFDTINGVGLFSLMAYLSIGFSTYALARRYSWPPTAFTVSMVVLSFPRLIRLAVGPGMEIIPAAVSLFCLVALYRTVERPNPVDFFALILGITFSVSGMVMCLTLPLLLAILSAVVLFRRHGLVPWRHLILDRPAAALAAFAPALIFSQAWLFLFNTARYDRWTGTPDPAVFLPNTDGLQGALANLLRYGIESCHLTRPMEVVCLWLFNIRLTDLLVAVYQGTIDPLFGKSGMAAAFQISWEMNTADVWFGPFGFVLIGPALLYAVIKAPRRLKATALMLIGYLYIVSLIPAWQPGNVRFLTPFFTCVGFSVAFFLPPWRFTRTGRRALETVCGLLIIYGCLSFLIHV